MLPANNEAPLEFSEPWAECVALLVESSPNRKQSSDGLFWQSTVGSTTLGQVILGYIRIQAGQAVWRLPLSSALERHRQAISMSSRPDWNTEQVPGQPPKQHRETLP